MTTSAELNISPYWDWHNSKPRIYTRQSQGRHPIWNENQAPCKLITKTSKYNRFQQLQHTNTQNLQKHETRNNNHLKQKSINFQAKLEKEALTSLIATSSFVWMLVPSPPKPKIKTINHQHTQQNPRQKKRTMSKRENWTNRDRSPRTSRYRSSSPAETYSQREAPSTQTPTDETLTH